jgi:hypothetical protein
MAYEVNYRHLENLDSPHIKYVRDRVDDFSFQGAYFINVDFPDQKEVLLCDGTNLVNVSSWCGKGIEISDIITPPSDVMDKVNKYLFY